MDKPKFYTGIGSRETPEHICQFMTMIARHLNNAGYVLRSGHADGADQAFEDGALNKEIYIPWPNFRECQDGMLPTEAAFQMAEEYHPAWDHLNRGGRALHARNCHQVLGPELVEPSEFVICWTPDGQASGGTGQALRVAKAYKIPIYNLYDESNRRYWEALVRLSGLELQAVAGRQEG